MKKLILFPLVVIWIVFPGPDAIPAQTYRQEARIDIETSEKHPPGRLVVSILWFENRAGPEAEHWRYGIKAFLSDQMRQLRAVRLRDGVKYARRELGIEGAPALNMNHARKIGELVEAQRVIWGAYQRRDEKWQITVYLLNVATGEVSDPLTATSTDWLDLRNDVIEQVMDRLKIIPSSEEKKKLVRRETTSPQALEWSVRALALEEEEMPLSEQEECLRKAIMNDPLFAEAFAFLGRVLANQGKFEQAEAKVQRALEIRTGYARAHETLGWILLHQKKYAEGENEFHKVLQLDPDDATALSGLGQFRGLVQGKWAEAIYYGLKAIDLEPMDADLHANLGFAYAHNRDRNKAMAALKEAERLAAGPNTEQMLAQAYEILSEIPLAVDYYERCVEQARKTGANPKAASAFEKKIERLRATLTPSFIEAQMPTVHTEQMLQSILRAKLTKSELQMVENPVASNPEIRRWALQLTEGAASDFDKAKAVFDGLRRRIQPEGGFGTRTAQQVFAAWHNPNDLFSCQEFAKLYLALVREVGVNAFYVHLGRDYRGRLVFHDCAIVFVGGKRLLVDPSYRWFGVPHREFVVLDDLQTVAHHLFQHTPGERHVARCSLAAKLHPDFAWGQICLAAALWAADEPEESLKALETADKLEPDRWDMFQLRGQMAVDREDWSTAITHLRNALELNPEDAESHFLLGRALAAQSKLEEAREEYRACLTHCLRNTTADRARRAIIQINEKIGSESAQGYETAALMVAAKNGRVDTIRQMIAEGADVNSSEASGTTALMWASIGGSTEAIRFLLDEGAEVNDKSVDGETALMFAADGGHVETVRLLIEMDAKVTLTAANGGTALMLAAQGGHLDVVELLLTRGAKVNTQNVKGVTALMLACEKDHLETALHLLEHGAQINVGTRDGITALMATSIKGHLETARLLVTGGAPIDARNATGTTSLMLACRNGHTEVVQFLLDEGANINTKDHTGATSLIMACDNGHTEVVNILIKNSADVNAKKIDGGTALMGASVAGFPEVVKILLEAVAKVEAKTLDGRTALMWACQYGHTNIVRLLLDNGAMANATTIHGMTGLILAAGNGHNEVADLLLEKGADPEARMSQGFTALVAASHKGHADMVRLLLEKGANVREANSEGITAVMLASQEGHTKIVQILIDGGADVNRKRNDGVTALMMASANGKTETANLLIQKGADLLVYARDNTALSLARNGGHTEIAELLVEAMKSHLSVWLIEGMPISESEVLEYYERIKVERFITSAKLQFRLIHIRPLNLKPAQIYSSTGETPDQAAIRIATELIERVEKGEDFGELAQVYSHGHRRLHGGLWPQISPGSLAPPYNVLAEQAKNMQIGQMAKPILSDGHVFIMKLENRIEQDTKQFNEVKDSLEEELRALKRKKLGEAIRQE